MTTWATTPHTPYSQTPEPPDFTLAGGYPLTVTLSGATSLTVPTSGVMATLAGAETLSGKTLTAPILTAPVLGTPASGTLTNCAGLPASGVVGTAVVASGGNLTGGINSARGNITQHATTMDFFATTSPGILDGTGSAVTITACVNAPQGGATRKFYPIVATVLTHGATFDIAGNANLTAAAGDCWIIEAKTVSTYRVTAAKEDGTAVVAVTVTDATIATSDVTTNNASSAKHGFCPKAPADPAKFLNGANPPAFAVPTGTLTAGTALTQNPYAVSTLVTQAHGLAVEPTCYKIILECLTADNGWVTGDRVVVNMLGGASSGNPGWAIYADATNFYMRTTNNLPLLTPKNGAASFTITAASWKIIITPYKLN